MNKGTVSFRTGTIWLGVMLIVASAGVAVFGYMGGNSKLGTKAVVVFVICLIGLIGWTQIYK